MSSLSKLEVPLLTSCSRPTSPWLACPPAPCPTGGAAWSPTTWSVLEAPVWRLAAMWVSLLQEQETKKQSSCEIQVLRVTHIFICCSPAGRLWWSSELPELRWILGCPRYRQLRLKRRLQLPQEALCLHQSQCLHQLDQQREWSRVEPS